MNNKQQFIGYLTEKKKKQSYIDECADFANHFTAVFDTKSTAFEGISAFISRIHPRGLVAVRTAYLFLNDYAKFAETEQPLIADKIRVGCRQIFEQTAKDEVRRRKQSILPIPTDARIAPQHLGELTNEQFVAAFGDFQQLVIACYDDIEAEPFAWGYPDFYNTGGYYNRVNDILFALVFCGKYSNGALTVNAAKFFAYTGVKRHKKTELIISGLERFGFVFESFNKKSSEFFVSYPKNPYIVTALHAYVSVIDEREKQDWSYGIAINGFSYRYIEDASVQTHERVFLAEMDYASEALRKIQIWLHAEAAKFGFYIDPNDYIDKGCILYKKSSKRFLLAGENEGKIWSKTSFIKTFEEAPEKMRELCNRFPNVFRLEDAGKCCHENKCMFRMKFTFDGVSYLRCGLGNFIFQDINLEDIKAILDVFKIENKIKQLI